MSDDTPPIQRRRRSPAKAALASLDHLDQRTSAARGAVALRRQIVADLGGDLSAVQTELATRLSVLAAYCADSEARWLTGQPLDESYLAAVNALKRLAETLGIERKPPPIKTLQQHMADRPALASPTTAAGATPIEALPPS